MKKIFKLSGLLLLCMALTMPVLTSCENDDFNTQQYRGGVSLNVWGPRPVARGGELRFLGSGMDQITSITLPGTNDITDIRVISSEEIRITVPQDAAPGYVVLHHANGDIKSITELSFTEPISLEEIAPMSIKPGAVLTLKGDYLNLISEVILPEEVTIAEEDFITHTRKEISFTVPAEAQSGKVIISDGAEPIPNHIESDEEITVVLPQAVNVLDLTGAKPGQTVEIPMTDIDLVTKLVMPNEDEVEFTVNDDKLTFTLPANVSDGSICVIPASGVKIAVATIGVAVPEEVEAVPADNVWSGDALKFKGINMELVTGVTFPNIADAVAPDATSPTEITVTIPEGTQSGNAVLHTASGASVEVAISTIKPENVAYNPAPAALAGSLTVSGKNLQNVASINFAGTASVEVKNPEATSFTISVPATLQAGSNTVTLVLTNGEKVEAPAIELTAPECAYATELPAEDAEIKAGETFTLPVANESLLTEVQVNGQKTQHILQGTNLIILVPETVGSTGKVTLVSSNGSIEYEIAFIPATHVENVIWTGLTALGWNDEKNKIFLPRSYFENVPAGAKMILACTTTGDDPQIQYNDVAWAKLYNPGEVKYPTGVTSVTAELTAEVLNQIMTAFDEWNTGNGMIIQGQDITISKIHIEWERSLETVIFEGPCDLTWDDKGRFGLDIEFFKDLKAGSKITFYCSNFSGGQIQFNDCSWSNIGNLFKDEVPCNEHNCILAGDYMEQNNTNQVTLTLTQEVLDVLASKPEGGDYFGVNDKYNVSGRIAVIIQGSGMTIDKITVQ